MWLAWCVFSETFSLCVFNSCITSVHNYEFITIVTTGLEMHFWDSACAEWVTCMIAPHCWQSKYSLQQIPLYCNYVNIWLAYSNQEHSFLLKETHTFYDALQTFPHRNRKWALYTLSGGTWLRNVKGVFIYFALGCSLMLFPGTEWWEWHVTVKHS